MKKISLLLLIPALLIVAGMLKAESIEDLQKACNNGNLDSCVKLGNMYYQGSSVKKDFDQAFIIYSKACTAGNNSACASLGKMYDKGEGVAENIGKAAQLYLKACDAGISTACDNVRVLYNIGKNVAFESRTQECNNGNSDACIYLGFLVRYENKISLNTKKVSDALVYYTRECDNNEASGCYFLGVMYDNGNGVKKDQERASQLYKKSCSLGYKKACEK